MLRLAARVALAWLAAGYWQRQADHLAACQARIAELLQVRCRDWRPCSGAWCARAPTAISRLSCNRGGSAFLCQPECVFSAGVGALVVNLPGMMLLLRYVGQVSGTVCHGIKA